MQEKLLMIVKIILAILLLPIVIGSTIAFQQELSRFDALSRNALIYGMGSYIILKLFVYDFSHVYLWGQNLITNMFQFLKPLVNLAPYVIPVYSMIVLIAYAVVACFGKVALYKSVFLFLFAFTFVMHIVLTAQDLYKKDGSAIKPTYFFGMSLVYILDVFLIALLASLILPGFSFPEFFGDLTAKTKEIYQLVISQLFKA